jgi:hypothetical protein
LDKKDPNTSDLTEDSSDSDTGDSGVGIAEGARRDIPEHVVAGFVALEEGDIKERTISKFFRGDYNEADEKTQAVFVLAYGACPIVIVPECTSKGGKMTLGEYLENVVPADIAMILYQMTLLKKKPEGSSNQSKSTKGGQPEGAKNLDGNWKTFKKYNYEETERRKDLEGGSQGSSSSKQVLETWYKAALEEINKICDESALGQAQGQEDDVEEFEEEHVNGWEGREDYDDIYDAVPSVIFEG